MLVAGKGEMQMHLSGNTILITGGSSGIGRALAEAFHREGNQVIVAGRRKTLLDEVAAANPGMQSVALDVQDSASLSTFVAEITQKHPTLNVLINNAGIMKPENLNDPDADFGVVEATIATNLIAPLQLTATLLPLLKKQPDATIMTVSSGLAFVPMALTPTYCATKAAIHSWTQSLRYQLQGTNVRAVELIPPYVQTELMGVHQNSDPRAMPLADFIHEAMEILRRNPDVQEINVQRVHPLRFAAEQGQEKYDQFFAGLNNARAAASGH
jgi:uncharacterized oxidoreductase